MKKNKFTRVPSDIFPPGAFELSVQYTRKNVSRIKLTNSDDVANYLRAVVYHEGTIEHVEQVYVLLLDRSNSCFAFKQISIGGIYATYFDPKIIFQIALLSHACQIIICHNHCSGNIKPSISDTVMTKKLKEGGDILEIKLVDHLILTADSYYSFADAGMI